MNTFSFFQRARSVASAISDIGRCDSKGCSLGEKWEWMSISSISLLLYLSRQDCKVGSWMSADLTKSATAESFRNKFCKLAADVAHGLLSKWRDSTGQMEIDRMRCGEGLNQLRLLWRWFYVALIANTFGRNDLRSIQLRFECTSSKCIPFVLKITAHYSKEHLAQESYTM